MDFFYLFNFRAFPGPRSICHMELGGLPSQVAGRLEFGHFDIFQHAKANELIQQAMLGLVHALTGKIYERDAIA